MPDDLVLRAFLLRVHPRLRQVLAHYRIPLQDAEDVVQNAVLSLLREWSRISDPEAWLLKALCYQCLQYWRSVRRSRLVPLDFVALEALCPPQQPEQEKEVLLREMERLMRRLRAFYRETLTFRYGYGYSSIETAARLGKTPVNVRKGTQRALEQLRLQAGWRR